MITLRLLVFVFSVCLFATCGSRSGGPSNSENDPAVPGVGLAPDSSNAVKDSTIQKQQADTASRKQ